MSSCVFLQIGETPILHACTDSGFTEPENSFIKSGYYFQNGQMGEI